VNRREFSAVLAGAAATAALAPRSQAAVSEAPAVSKRAKTLYRQALILDCNCSPPSQDRLPLPQADLDAIEGLYDKYFRATVHDRW